MPRANVVKQIYNALMMNLDTIQTHAMTQNNLTDATNQLQTNWSNRKRDIVNDPLDALIQQKLDAIDDVLNAKDPDLAKARGLIDDLIHTCMLPPKGSPYTQNQLLSHWSNQQIADVQARLSSCYDKDASPPVAAELSSFLNLVQAETTQELTPLQSLVKSEGSVIQKDGDAQQPLADAGNSFVTLFGSAANFLQQSYF